MNNSIFTIERRKNFSVSFEGFIDDLSTTSIRLSDGSRAKVVDYLKHCIKYWPYRYGANSIESYLKDISITGLKPAKDRERLLVMELLVNLLYWAPKQDEIDLRNESWGLGLNKSDVGNESERLLTNAEFILEQCCNMYIREDNSDKETKYCISKRNAVADATLEAVPALADIILGYFDIRNLDSTDYKEHALKAIYGYMEPKRNDYKGMVCSAVSEEFFTSMNRLKIRHKTESQVQIDSSNKNEVYDKLFKMALFVLQTESVNQYKDEMKSLREKT